MVAIEQARAARGITGSDTEMVIELVPATPAASLQHSKPFAWAKSSTGSDDREDGAGAMAGAAGAGPAR